MRQVKQPQRVKQAEQDPVRAAFRENVPSVVQVGTMPAVTEFIKLASTQDAIAIEISLLSILPLTGAVLLVKTRSIYTSASKTLGWQVEVEIG